MFSSIQELSYGVATSFFVLATITILLRIYSRGWVVKGFGWDDWCMVSILFFNAGHQAILYYFLQNGSGLRVTKVMTEHPAWLQNLVQALFAEEIMYTWMHFIIKTAFLLFYLRFATKTFRKLVFGTMAINAMFTIITILIYCFQCQPLEAFFNPMKHPDIKCLDNSVLAFVPAAFSISLDVIILILPIAPLWTIQVSLRTRLALISIISLGGIVVLISCIRLVVLLEFQKKNADFTYVLGKLIIISSIELEVAIMAANAPSLKILYQRWISGSAPRETTGANSTSNGTHERKRKSNFNSGLGYVADCSNYVPMASRGSQQQSQGASSPERKERNVTHLSSSSSEEQLWKHDSGITVTTKVGVETRAMSLRGGLPGTPEERCESAGEKGKDLGFRDQFDAV